MVVFRGHLFQRKYALLAIAIFIMGIVALMAASMFTDIESKIGSKLGMLSKSGDASELTSATGRTEIWGKAIELISKEPLFGYGAATSKFLLKDFSMHTHNLVLNVAFSTGIIGGFVALCMCLGRFFRLFVERHPIADALVVFILVNGLFENVIFSILCGLPTILWTVGLALPALEKINKEAEGTQIDHPILRVSAS
jgi:O-antigen ligase